MRLPRVEPGNLGDPDLACHHVAVSDPPDPNASAADIDRLGEMLREQRAKRGKSLRQVSAETGVPFTTLSRVEAGRLPDLTTFRNIVEWLGVSPERFFPTPRLRQESTTEIIADVLRKDPALNEDARDQIISVVGNLYVAATLNQQPVRMRLRSDRMFTPEAGALVHEILHKLQEQLLAEVEHG
jgi:transcriptional regulator with XRE-family HTH domain